MWINIRLLYDQSKRLLLAIGFVNMNTISVAVIWFISYDFLEVILSDLVGTLFWFKDKYNHDTENTS